MQKIPFKVPANFLAELHSGQVRRAGTILINNSTGRIVGHVQEAGRFSASIAGSVNPILQAGTLASTVTANVQLEQVKAMLGVLQLMNVATLAVSAIGLGVSVAGFAVVSSRLNRLSTKIEGLEKTVQALAGIVDQEALRRRARDRGAIASLMAQGEEAWKRRDQVDVWQELASSLSGEENYYRALLETVTDSNHSLLHNGRVPWEEVLAAHEALSHLVAARLHCLMLLEELNASIHYAESWSAWLSQSFDSTTPPRVVSERLKHKPRTSEASSDYERLDELEAVQSFFAIVRVQQDFAGSLPSLIGTLRERELSGRAYVEVLRNEAKEPLLVLDVGS